LKDNGLKFGVNLIRLDSARNIILHLIQRSLNLKTLYTGSGHWSCMRVTENRLSFCSKKF